VADGFWGLEGLAWSPDGTKVLFSGSRAGWNFEVWIADLGGGAMVALPTPVSLLVHDIRRDGQWLLVRQDQRISTLARCVGTEEVRELGWLDNTYPACLSADGKLLLFGDQSLAAGNNYAVCLQRTDGSPSVRLGEGTAMDLSPDQGRALAILKSPTARVVTYPTGAGEPETLNTEGLSSIDDARWSRDGTRVFVIGSESGITTRVYALDSAGGAPKAMTPEGLILGISPVGSVVMRDKAGTTLLVRPDGDAPRPIVGLGASDGLTKHWSRDDGSVLVYDANHIPLSIEWLNLATGARTPFTTLSLKDRTGLVVAGDVVVSEDERSIACSVSERREFLFTSDPAREAEKP
jgi:WD40 repeat protein